jgi:predicted regulator of Ras-like GTPase activity (Roadblock/LC7/MglB family)
MTMTIPFLNLFKRVKDQALAKKDRAVAEPNPAAPLEKPSTERFSKTVMPNATRTLPAVQEQTETPALPRPMVPAPIQPAKNPPRTISFGAPPVAPARLRDLPPAVALALEPRVERVISLQLADIVEQIPVDYIKPLESIDSTRRVLLKASEVEKGMATGKPAVSLATIFQQVPEIFLRTIAPVDDAQVYLPFEKVLKQFTSMQVRGDQEKHSAVPQVETPFLQATLEDNTKFGTTTEVGVEANDSARGDLPPVRIELATAEAYAAAEPEANGYVLKQPASDGTSASPTRVPLKFSPNGTGGPAPEGVPASRGPSVPTSTTNEPTPTRIPFQVSEPPELIKDEPWLTAENITPGVESTAPKVTTAAPVAATPSTTSKVTIRLALRPILKALPPFQAAGDPSSVPEDAAIEIPFYLIEPQLATGRIALTPAAFEAAMPQEHRALFKIGEQAADVILPLQDVLKNLPVTTLNMRTDQVVLEAGPSFVTPFSAQADEDAKRFNPKSANVAGTPVAPVKVEEATQSEVVQPATAAKREPFNLEPTAAAAPAQAAVETDAKAVVEELKNLAGIKGCAFMFGDGLSLAGSLPPEYETEGLCAMGPALMQRIQSHMVETKLGVLESMSLSCTKGAISFFVHQNLCLAAFHTDQQLATEVREKLAHTVHELSQKYSHPV